MDRTQIIGLVVMLVFITVYFTFFAPEPTPPEPSINTDTIVSQSSQDSPIQQTDSSPALTDSARAKYNELKYGLFSPLSEGTEQAIQIENKDLILTFSTKGGLITNTVLKNFKDFRGNPLVLADQEHSEQHLVIDHLSRKVDLSELYFQTTARGGTVNSGDTMKISFTLNLGEGRSIQYLYAIPAEGYQINYDIKTNGIQDLIGQDLLYTWNLKMNRVEMDFEDSRNRSTIIYRLTDGEVDELTARSTDLEEETLETPVHWASFRQKFFTSAIISTTPFERGYIKTQVDLADTTTVKTGQMSLKLAYSQIVGSGQSFTYYFGPNNYSILKEVTADFSDNVELGWSILSWINKWMIIPIFHFLEDYVGNYGVIIIIMVFIIRLLLAPLTYTSHMGMAKMRVMKPELDEIKERHKDDMQKAQQEQMALYQKVGINPLAGCIPMLLQMPILFSMFYFFPNSIELRQEGFLWAHDLSTYDSILDLPFTIPFYGDHVSLFTLLMTASTILYTWSNSQVTTVQGPMKSLQYVMPIMFLFFLNSYSSGLTFYYFVSNIVSFGQIAMFRRFIDEDKIKKTLEENKKKNANKKKSSFQQRLEEAMKANQEAKKNQKKKKK